MQQLSIKCMQKDRLQHHFIQRLLGEDSRKREVSRSPSASRLPNQHGITRNPCLFTHPQALLGVPLNHLTLLSKPPPAPAVSDTSPPCARPVIDVPPPPPRADCCSKPVPVALLARSSRSMVEPSVAKSMLELADGVVSNAALKGELKLMPGLAAVASARGNRTVGRHIGYSRVQHCTRCHDPCQGVHIWGW